VCKFEDHKLIDFNMDRFQLAQHYCLYLWHIYRVIRMRMYCG